MKKYLLTATILSAAMPTFGQTITRQTTFSPIITSSPTITNNFISEPSLTTSIVNGPIQSPTDSNDSQPSGPSIPSTSSPSVDIGRLPGDDAPTFINPIAPSIGDVSGGDAVDDDSNWGDVLTFPEFDDSAPDDEALRTWTVVKIHQTMVKMAKIHQTMVKMAKILRCEDDDRTMVKTPRRG